jgi:hypothetical protein
VLHVWNTAGVASVVAKFVDRLYGTESSVMVRRAYDRVGLTTYGTVYDDGAARFLLRCLSSARAFDVVHVYSLDRIVPWLKRLYPGKPVVMYYVGTDILGRWEEKRRRWTHADAVAYSTVNLAPGAPESAIHIPAPVDTDMFHPLPVERKMGTALARRYGMEKEVEAVAASKSLSLEWMDTWGVPHGELPMLFSSFEYFIDMRRPEGHANPVTSVGKAALEALACGCKAIVATGETIESLPPENRPEGVAKAWHALYTRLVTEGRR